MSLVLGVSCLACSRSETGNSATGNSATGSSETGSPETGQHPLELWIVPEPDLSGAGKAVREQIKEQLAAVQTLRDREDPNDNELAGAMGDLGLLYFTYGFVQAAEVSFVNAKLLAPEDYRWPYLLGYVLKMEGRLPEAVGELKRALDLEPDNQPGLLRLGNALLEMGSNVEAQPLFERALEVDKKSAAAFHGLGKVAAAAGDHEKAAGLFLGALEIQPSATSVHHALGLSYRNLGRLDEARSHLEQGGDAPVQVKDPLLLSLIELGRSVEIYLVRAAEAMDAERWDQAASLYRKALEIDASDFMAHKALGFALEKLGDLDGAIEQLHVALSTATSGDEERDRMERSEIYRVMGGLEVLHGRERDAIKHFEMSLEIDPKRLDSRLKLANALARAGQLDSALSHYDVLLEHQPDNAVILVKRATALVNLRRPEEALAAFKLAVAASPENPEVRLRYAEALEYLGETSAAKTQRAAIASGTLEDSQRTDLMITEARKLTRDGQYDTAAKRYLEVLAMDSENIDAHYELATILGHQGRFDDALKRFATVIEQSPLHAPARRGEITALLLQGRYGVAREKLRQALSVMPRDRQMAHALARLLATAPDPQVRSGQLAVELASRVFAVRREPATAETLAMAYAEAGQFAEALELQRQLVAAADGRASDDTVARLRKTLLAYEGGQPWRASSPDEILSILADPGTTAG